MDEFVDFLEPIMAGLIIITGIPLKLGFDLFDIKHVTRYSAAALPAAYDHHGFSQNVYGRVLQGNALYLRDPCTLRDAVWSLPLFTEEEVVAAIRGAGGVLSGAAKLLGCGRPTISKYIERFPAARAALEEAGEISKTELLTLIGARLKSRQKPQRLLTYYQGSLIKAGGIEAIKSMHR